MKFEWDEAKSLANQRKHGIRFEEAQTVFNDPLAASIIDQEHTITEERWQTIGMSSKGQLMVVAHTYSGLNDNEVIRIISARQPTASERRSYEDE